MKKQDTNPRRERQLRFAEAGILFVFILGIAIFIGVGMRGDEETVEAVAETHPTAVAVPTVAEAEPVADSEPAIEAADSATVAAAASAPSPEPVVVTYPMAESAYFAGDYAAASDLFTAYVESRPENAWGHYMLGLSCWKSGDAVTADAAFAAALDLRPDHFKSLVNGARVLLDLDRDEEAAVRIASALELEPTSGEALRVQARLFHRQGRLDEAVATYETILHANLDDAWALNNLGLLLIEQGDYDSALAPLARAASLRDAACIRNNLGAALERTGHYTAAAAAYERALELEAGYAKAEVSLERVSGLVEDPARDAVDLEALAAGFGVATEEPLPVATVTEEFALAATAVAESDELTSEESEEFAVPETTDETGPEPPEQEMDGEGNRRR